MSIKTVLVTGGAGFLGYHVCYRLLNENNKVICVDNLISGSLHNISEFFTNDNFSFYQIDITNSYELFENLCKEEQIDEIYHLACIASPEKYKVYSIETLITSFEGTKNILNIAKHYNSKLLFTSTSEIYGDPLVHPQPEEYFGNVNTVGERSCYDEGKRVAESLIYEYRKRYNLDLKIVRLFNTYGPHMSINDGRVITNFIYRIINNKPIQIYGTGEQTRSFCYVDDLIDGLFLMMDSCEIGPINLGNPNCEFTLNELVSIFEEIIERSLDVEYLRATGDDPKQRKPDITKAVNLLSFDPKVTLKDGLRKTIDSFKEYLI